MSASVLIVEAQLVLAQPVSVEFLEFVQAVISLAVSEPTVFEVQADSVFSQVLLEQVPAALILFVSDRAFRRLLNFCLPCILYFYLLAVPLFLQAQILYLLVLIPVF